MPDVPRDGEYGPGAPARAGEAPVIPAAAFFFASVAASRMHMVVIDPR
ncbi:MAG: hypothetical protein JWQ05_2187, partial [Methylobacterium sp.]|nr:hypothetical protein [Methylobacterium sp.]